MGGQWFLLLLPVAAAFGWWYGRRSLRRRQVNHQHALPRDYYKGLNYLINEQPDRATDVFLRVLDVDSESIEVHYALASLFIKRGEVDRAIRIHQNLIARPTLSREQRNETLFYLAQDYLRAGVLDRAEGIFRELDNNPNYAIKSLNALLNIYQQQQEWKKAIEIAHCLQRRDSEDYAERIGQYYCELAEQTPAGSSQQRKLLRLALSNDAGCGRATLIEGGALLKNRRYKEALRVLRRIEKQDVSLIGEALQLMEGCWSMVDGNREKMNYLNSLMQRYPNMGVLYTYMDGLAIQDANAANLMKSRLKSYVEQYPSIKGVLALLQFSREAKGGCEGQVIRLLKSLDSSSGGYQCSHCGFEGHAMHWQCPSCKSWNHIRHQNISGEQSLFWSKKDVE